jgi:predicted transcriptional regulator
MRPRANKIPTSIRLPADLKKKLQAIADERRQPVSLMIVWIVEQWAKEYVAKQDWEKRERELARINR